MTSNSKVYYAIALKFSARQINLITKKSVSAICEIMNINVDIRILVNASHSVKQGPTLKIADTLL